MSGGWGGTWLRGGKGILAWMAAAYLAFVPLGSFVVIPVGGTHASGSDLLLGMLLLLGTVTLVRSPGFRATVGRGLTGGSRVLRFSGSRSAGDDFGASLLLFAAFGIWAAASGLWAGDPAYALTRGTGYLALSLAVGVIVWSGIEWDRALGAWLLGAFATVALSLALAGVGVLTGGGAGWPWADRVLYQGGSLVGLPGPRLRGPFLHPNGLGDYLVISGGLLWAWWPGRTRMHSEAVDWMARGGALLLIVALVLSPSSAWVAAGVLLLLWGRSLAVRRGGGGSPLLGLVLRGGGAVVAATTLAALVFPLRIGWGGFQIVSSGIRVPIWEDALRAFLSNPLIGVGAAPVLADVVDPVDPSAGLQVWDAHNAYLSVLGQFGVVGALLTGGAVFFLVRAVVRAGETDSAAASSGTILRPEDGASSEPPGSAGIDAWRLRTLRERARRGILAVLLAIGVHALVIAGEDLHHWWMLASIAALVGGDGAGGDPEATNENTRLGGV